MATLDSFREATGEPIQLDLANGYIADIRLNAGDINGRTITVELTDNGTPITTTAEITCALDYNTSPGSSLGDRVTMSPVSGAATATFRAAVPRKALAKPGRILLGIEISSGGHKVCSRNFYGLVERAVFDATSPDADDKLGRIEQLILDADKATSSANTAAGKANTAATAANTAAAAANTATGKANTATTNASAAATAASTAASKANGAASSATTAASNANDKATAADTAATAAATAAGKANDAASKATSAAGDARDAAEAARTSTIEYAQLSDDCKEKIAASNNDPDVLAQAVDLMTRAKCDSEFYLTTAEKYYEVKPSAETALFLAQAFQNKQEYDKAIKYLTEALAVETDNVEKEKLLVRIGVVQLATKNYAEARKAALEAQALNPEDGMTYFVLAQCYGAQASGANFTSQAMYWVAYDTMEKAAQLLEEADLKETATKMMAAFRSAWPSKEECFFNEVQAGQRYVVNGIATTVRCIR